MNVGDYVRTKDGKIVKCFKSESMNKPIYYVIGSATNSYIEYQDVITSSPNIIDLIEENDILKIEERRNVYTICEVEKFKEPYTNYEFLGVRLENQPVARKLYELNIKSIVTKEQFERDSYKVE